MRVRREGPRKYLTQYSVCHENGKIPKPTLKCLCVVAHWEGRDSDLWGSLASQLSLVDDSSASERPCLKKNKVGTRALPV